MNEPQTANRKPLTANGEPQTANRKPLTAKGATLIEVMLAMLILLIVAVGGAAFLYHSSSRIAIQRNKRVALEEANSCLEEMRISGYTVIEPTALGYPADWSAHGIKKAGTGWIRNDTDDETVTINGIVLPITTTVQYVDAQGEVPPNSYDYILAVVRIGYRVGSDERVRLETYFIP